MIEHISNKRKWKKTKEKDIREVDRKSLSGFRCL